MAHHPDVIQQKLDYLKEVEHIWKDVQMHGDCLSLKDLKISGKELIADGMKPGPEVGNILGRLLVEVLEYPERNEATYLLERSRELREEKADKTGDEETL